MNPREEKLRILTLLRENLTTPQPQVVELNKIVSELQLDPKMARNLLLQMDQAGAIQSDIEGSHALITPVGLSCLEQCQSGQFAAAE